MSIKEALTELILKPEFKEKCRTDANYRVNLKRIKDESIKTNAAASLLQEFGYKVIVEQG